MVGNATTQVPSWRTAAGAALLVLLAGTPAAFCLPVLLSSVFTGVEGTRWVLPMGLWMTVAGSLFVLGIPLLYRRFAAGEEVVALGVAWFLAALLAFIALQRLGSGLRVLESHNQVMVMRVAAGGNLYPDPQLEPGGPIYAPLYFLVCGLLHRLLAASFAWGRVVSLGCTLGTALLTAVLARRLGAARGSAVWAPALFLATYPLLNMLYDNVMVDPLLMLLLTAGGYLLVGNTPRQDGAALVVLGLACFTKQTAALPAAAGLAIILFSRRSIKVYWSVPLFIAAGVVLLLVTNGRAWVNLVRLPGSYGWQGMPFPRRMIVAAILHFPLLVCAVIGAIRSPHPRFLLYCGALIAAATSGLVHAGGWINTLMILEGVMVAQGACLLPRRKVLLALQLVVGLYNPFPPLYPWSTIRDPDRAAIALAGKTAGPVWFPVESDLAYRSGTMEWDNAVAIDCITWAGEEVPRRLVDAIRMQHFELILMRESSRQAYDKLPPTLRQLVDRLYKQRESPHPGLRVLEPLR